MLSGGERSIRVLPPRTGPLVANSTSAMEGGGEKDLPTGPPDREAQSLDICNIRRDGKTQHRVAANPAVVVEYADLMRAGVVFPPVTVWFDGEHYWLSDGFQRIAACERIGRRQISAVVHDGTLSKAQWDSYRANSDHGLRRTDEDLEAVIRAALRHPNAASLSNVQIARHLNIAEATLRRWRRRLSSSRDEDSVRVVKRGGSEYSINVANIGKAHRNKHIVRRGKDLRREIGRLKSKASPEAGRVLNLFEHWLSGALQSANLLDALEDLIRKP